MKFTNEINYIFQLKTKLSSAFQSLFGKQEARSDAVSFKLLLKGLLLLLVFKFSVFELTVRQTRET